MQPIYNNMNRITINYNGEEIAGLSTSSPRPQNENEMLCMIEEIVDILVAKNVNDPDLF